MKLVGLAIVIAGLSACCASAAALPSVAVADFDYHDHSGEVRDQSASHAAFLKSLQADIIGTLDESKRVTAAKLFCPSPPCSADSMQADDLAQAAQAQRVIYVVFGGVEKVSTLIQFGQVEIMDAATRKSVLSRAVTFRGDDPDAWRHASDYIARMVLDAVQVKSGSSVAGGR